jgi:hypothetical protein
MMTPVKERSEKKTRRLAASATSRSDGVRAPLDPFDKSAPCSYYRFMIPKKSNGAKDLLNFRKYFGGLMSSNFMKRIIPMAWATAIEMRGVALRNSDGLGDCHRNEGIYVRADVPKIDPRISFAKRNLNSIT